MSASQALVIIPTYNESENITAIINAVMALPSGFDLLIVDDNSPDGTAALVQALQPQYPTRLQLLQRPGKQGLGTAYIHGFRQALSQGYAYIFEMDADFSHNPQDLEALYQACAHEGFDVAIGSRYITGVNVVNWPMGRVLMSYFASYYVRLITGMPIRDTTAGFKCYRAEVLRTIDLSNIRFVGYAFQIEMKFLAWKHGFKLKEVPIIFTDRSKGQSKMSSGIFKEALWGVIAIKLRSLFRRYQEASQQS
ncbi:polyprenol monophosphomannose synthase [Eisenibacter elegans]|uniref:polyprenol monophosphomannose synthase n=1 Tax=Eisenibacter elegans TaxID=997 RepID=UPI00047C2B0C|nr:polyprenol monophosphomannose synthase [Eisenibacter elegans]